MQKSLAQKRPPPVAIPPAHHQLYFEFFQDLKTVHLSESPAPIQLSASTKNGVSDPELELVSISLKNLRKADLASRMLEVAMNDLSYMAPQDSQLFAGIGKGRQMRKQDALIWIYSLSPRDARLTFEWVCEELDQDPEIYRRVIAKNCRKDLKVIVQVLVSLLGFKQTKQCVEQLSDYVDLTGWENN